MTQEPQPEPPRAARTTLVTGGAGFIGSHLCEALLGRGEDVLVLDDLSTGCAANLEALEPTQPGAGQLRFVRGDVTDAALVESLVSGVDRVVHLAALVGVRLVLEAPLRTMRTNVEGTRCVLEACARHGVRCLIASSSEVYGKSPRLPFREQDTLLLGATSEPRWAYACSKAMGEWMALAHAAEDDLDVRIVRYFNVVGRRQRGRYGMVLPNFVRQARAGEALTVFGDGEQTRCFLDVRDAARASLLLLDADLDESTPAGAQSERVFNVGSESELSIQSLAERVRAHFASDSDIVHMPYREAYGMSMHDLRRRVPDLSRLERHTGFRPRWRLEDAFDEVAASQSLLPAEAKV